MARGLPIGFAIEHIGEYAIGEILQQGGVLGLNRKLGESQHATATG